MRPAPPEEEGATLGEEPEDELPWEFRGEDHPLLLDEFSKFRDGLYSFREGALRRSTFRISEEVRG